MPINYDTITDTQKLEVADIVSKMEAIDALLAGIQNERAAAQTDWNARENELQIEKGALTNQLRALRKAIVTKAI